MDCQAMEMDQLVALAQRRGAWNALPNNYAEANCHRTIGPPGCEMELLHYITLHCIAQRTRHEWDK